jgi:hypothetical protein
LPAQYPRPLPNRIGGQSILLYRGPRQTTQQAASIKKIRAAYQGLTGDFRSGVQLDFMEDVVRMALKIEWLLETTPLEKSLDPALTDTQTKMYAACWLALRYGGIEECEHKWQTWTNRGVTVRECHRCGVTERRGAE